MRSVFFLLPNEEAEAFAARLYEHKELCCSVLIPMPSGQCERFLNFWVSPTEVLPNEYGIACYQIQEWFIPSEGQIHWNSTGRQPQNGSNQSTFLKCTLKYLLLLF